MTTRISYLCGIISFLAMLFVDYSIRRTLIVLGIISFIVAYFSHGKNENKDEKTRRSINNINLHEFTLIDPPGYYTHSKYPYNICPSCLINKKLVSPVSEIEKDAWYCNVCRQPLSSTQGEVFTVDW